MNPTRFVAAQLRKPSGWFGSYFMGWMLDRTNAGFVAEAVDLLQLATDSRVLEIGFGTGHGLISMATKAPHASITGVDFSPVMVARAQRSARKRRLESRIHLSLGDAGQMPFENSEFDRVLTVNTIYFWANPVATLSEIGRVMKPKGRLALAFRPRKILQNYAFTTHRFLLYEPEEVADLFQAARFGDLQVIQIARGHKLERVVVLGERSAS